MGHFSYCKACLNEYGLIYKWLIELVIIIIYI